VRYIGEEVIVYYLDVSKTDDVRVMRVPRATGQPEEIARVASVAAGENMILNLQRTTCWHVVSDDRGFRWESCHLSSSEATSEALDRGMPSTIVQHREGCSHLACVEEH
jgi:hypothetical protein